MIDIEEISGGNDLDVVLFFTDGEGEPKKLNVTRCIEDKEVPDGVHQYSGANRNDFLFACQKTPQLPIQVSWDFSGDELDSDNFGFRDGLQFSYQIISKDNFVSAPATFSETAYPPALIQLGQKSVSSVSFEDEAVLKIPLPSAEAKRIRILFREGATGVFKIIDEVSAEVDEGNEFFFFDDTDSDFLGSYVFRYNRIYAVMPEAEALKTHDNLPKKAVAQTVAGNRLMYGNYNEGYDPVTTKVNITPLYGERPKDLENLGTTITPTYVATDEARTGGARGASISFSIECGLDSNIQKGVYDITISMSPLRNVHLFNGQKTLPSRNLEFNGDLGFADLPDAIDTSVWTQDYDTNYAGSGRQDTSGDLLTNLLPNFGEGQIASNSGYKNCGHVAFDQPSGIGAVGEEGIGVIGASSSSPLILGIENIRFNLILDVTNDNGISPAAFISILEKVLEGHSGSIHSGSSDATVLFAQGADGPIDAQVDGAWPGLSHRGVYNKNFESGNSFEASSAKTNLISCAVDPGTGTPCKFFVVNKFSIDSYIEMVAPNSSTSGPLYDTGTNPQSSTKRYFRVHFRNFFPEEVLTCIPKPVEGFGTAVRAVTTSSGSTVTQTVGLGSGIPGQTERDQYSFLSVSSDNPAFTIDTPWWINILNQNIANADVEYRTFKWPIIRVEGFDSSSDFNPGQPSHIDILNKEDELVTIDASGMLHDSLNMIPVPIGEWYAFTKDQIDSGEWAQSFETVISVQNAFVNIDFTAVPPNTQDWLKQNNGSSYSKGWAEPCTFNFSEFSFDQATASKYISAMDGENGIGGAQSSTFNDQKVKWLTDGDVVLSTSISAEQNGPDVSTLNTRGSVTNLTLLGFVNNMPFIDIERTFLEEADVIPSNKKAAPLQDSGSFLSVQGSEIGNPFSFKTNDFHDFGVVYFDERGRPGGVNKLDSVYVKGYGDRGDEGKGSVSIRIGLEHQPPPWAKTFKIVYGGSSNTRRFIQYTSAGAFVESGAVGGLDDKIYVSLNHLQESKASYAKSYGAKDVETGESLLYRFAEGDKLRVVSYFEDDSTVVFPSPSSDYTFDVVGMEIISRLQEDNPIYEETDINIDFSDLIPRTGSFAVIRNNINALGFAASNVALETDFWNNRCVFEIVTPKSEANDLTRPYYETGVVGEVREIAGGTLSHLPNNVTVDKGDVFFRAVPTNIPNFSNNSFENLILADEDGNDLSESRFRAYFLETNSLTDAYKATSKSFGKAYFIGKSEFEQQHGSSIIYSAATGARSVDYEYTSFNPNAENNFDLPFANGDLDYMSNLANELLVIQNSKAGKLQVNKAITRSSDGIDTLNLSNDVLSSQRFFQAELGTYGHPESVSVVNSSAYFVDSSKGVVVEVGPNGIKRISDAGMGAFLQRRFRELGDDVRITTGYNPDKNEIIVSAFKTSATQSDYPLKTSSEVNSMFNLGQSNIFSEGDAFTFAYSLSSEGFWATEYSFNSSQYSRVGDKFLSFKNGPWLHDVLRTPSFYGKDYPTAFKSVLVDGANRTKDFKAISIDGEFYEKDTRKTFGSPWYAVLDTKKESKAITQFIEREGTQYSEIRRSSQQGVSKSHFASLGRGAQVVNHTFNLSVPGEYEVSLKFDKRIDNQHITTSYSDTIMSRVCVMDGGQITGFGNFDSNDLIPLRIEDDGKTLICRSSNPDIFDTLIEQTFASLQSMIIIESRSDVFGDALRDKMMSISMVSTNADQNKLIELYSVNTEYTDSKLDSSS